VVVTIDKAGRVVIPKALRERLDLVPGTELDLEVEGDAVRISARRERRRELTWVDGRPVFRAVPGHSLTDADVRRLRDADQR